ncbi:unnamed protein product [Choristocarpus tenellus]
MFGITYTAEPVTEELLPPENMVVPAQGQPLDFRKEMKDLLWSVMANYQQFLTMLVSCPSHAHKKVSDLETIFVSMHTLLNRFRAHQGRHILIQRMIHQLKQEEILVERLEATIRECQAGANAAAEGLRMAEWKAERSENGSHTADSSIAASERGSAEERDSGADRAVAQRLLGSKFCPVANSLLPMDLEG